MVKLRFDDGRVREAQGPDQIVEIVKEECPDLADRVIGLKTDGRVVDLNAPTPGDGEVRPVFGTDSDPVALEILRHSTAHLLAQAVRDLYGEKVQYTIGPALIEDFKYGFYYDFDLPEPVGTEDLAKIEKRMHKLAQKREAFVRHEVPVDQAKAEFEKIGQGYKVELIDDLVRNEGVREVSLYRHGQFLDLCRGPHVPHSAMLKVFKLLSVAGAYWRGDAANKMLTRIYGVAYFEQENLDKHLERIAEAERRDHRVLGKQLDLYSISDLVGPGLILWHPNGAIIRQTIERFWIDEHIKHGYKILYTPHIAHERIYQTSGHLEAYGEMMYSPMDIEGQNFRVKPMNCPGHLEIFKSQTRSYRDLPLRYCELGTVYRYEPSGTLHGMLRVRGFTQDDAHVFCSLEQLTDEIEKIYEFVDFMMRTFGYQYKVELATRPEKSIGTDEEWEKSTAALRAVLDKRRIPYGVEEGGGVFYGPKIQMLLVDSLGREWQGPTVQVDLNLPRRFGCTYIGADNREHVPVMIHRALLGSMERFVGGLVEHYAGAFPIWLAPVQVVVMPVSEKFNAYGRQVYQRLFDASVRVELDDSDDKIGAKIRRATMQKAPYMLIVGAREQEAGQVSVRSRKAGDVGQQDLEGFVAAVTDEIKTKAL